MFFDNTARVKALAKTVQLDNSKGQEQKMYNVGDIVKTSPVCPYSLIGKVIEAYQQNGYWYYVTESNKGRTVALRTKDIAEQPKTIYNFCTSCPQTSRVKHGKI